MNIDKPTPKTLKYYDWHAVEEYLIKNGIWDEDFASDVWGELCISNGKPFTISDWELKHDKGRFAYLLNELKKTMVTDLMEHFGEPDTGCLDPGVLTATFIASW